MEGYHYLVRRRYLVKVLLEIMTPFEENARGDFTGFFLCYFLLLQLKSFWKIKFGTEIGVITRIQSTLLPL